MPLAEWDEAGGVRHDGRVEMKIMIYEGMYFWRRVVHACGRRVSGKKAVDKATISSSGSGPRAGYSCTDPVKWYVYSYQFMMNGSLLGLLTPNSVVCHDFLHRSCRTVRIFIPT